MTVALEDLRGRGRGLEPQAPAGGALELRIGGGVGSDRAGELSDTHPLEGAHEPLASAIELERPPGELQAERRRLGMDTVRPADLECRAVLFGPRDHRRERGIESVEHEYPRLPDLEREGGVDDVGGGEAVVEPAALLAEAFGDPVDEGCC